MFLQLLRFCVVGGANTGLDLLVFNVLLMVNQTQNSGLLIAYNSLAYLLGAVNSFLWNKYWTFREHRHITASQLVRFALVTGLGILCNDMFLWMANSTLSTLMLSGWWWTNTAKVCAIGGSFLVSYFGMHLSVFRSPIKDTEKVVAVFPGHAPRAVSELTQVRRSLSVVFPAYNEEATIVQTLSEALDTLIRWGIDFELIVVDDGSKDQTAMLVQQFAWRDARVRLILHQRNRGYGEALKSGFQVATKQLLFFMDSDGQFALQDLTAFFPLIEEYDAVLGYRLERQDTWLRKCNAFWWNALVRFVFGVRVRDIDCAFKLFRSNVLQSLVLESGGAMLNTEVIYKWSRRGATYTQQGVRHYPRQGGKATGAKLHVIVRALGQVFFFAEKWRKEEMELSEV